MRRAILIILSCLLFFVCGCGTIVHGTNQVIQVTSNPDRATVKLASGNTYTTPAAIKLARKRDHVLVISKKGYDSEQVVIMHVVSGAVAGNIIAGGLIGWGVDAMSGGQWKLVPETVHVELKPLKEGELSETEKVEIKLDPEKKLKRLDDLREKNLISEEEYQAMRKVILEKMCVE